MALALVGLYKALRAANVPEDMALEAAEEVAALKYKSRVNSTEFNTLRTDFLILKWMLVVTIALTFMALVLIPHGPIR